jgi:hypothetical protein
MFSSGGATQRACRLTRRSLTVWSRYWRCITWDKSREFEEWMQVVNDAARAESVRTVVRALAEAGRTAGMGLCIKDAQVVFFHRWRLVKAAKPLGH